MTTPRLRLRIAPAAERAVRTGHPWVFADKIREQNRAGKPGELAVLFDRQDRFLAIGLFDPLSPIRVRVLHTGEPVLIDAAWWHARLRLALARRGGMFDDQTNGHRWINGESDGWPGLVLDRYDANLVLKIYSAAWLSRLAEMVGLIQEVLQPERIVLRLSRNILEPARAYGSLSDGQVLTGAPLSAPVVFSESGLHFEAEILRGQKTGFFLDQRENRRAVEFLTRGRAVLNAFSFSGGFSLYAARGGAMSVTDLDLSRHALESAQRNFSLNQHLRSVSACRHETLQADAFVWLSGNRERRFDLVVLDPPSLAKREDERAGAVLAYAALARNGITCLRESGILVAASCSAHVSEAEFFGVVRKEAARSGRKFEEIQTTGPAADHPAAFPEAHYLKCIYLRFD